MTIESASRSAELREMAWKSPQAGPRSSRVERMQYRAAGTVSIPAPGSHQVIMNLWSQGQSPAVPPTTVIIRSFSYTPSA